MPDSKFFNPLWGLPCGKPDVERALDAGQRIAELALLVMKAEAAKLPSPIEAGIAVILACNRLMEAQRRSAEEAGGTVKQVFDGFAAVFAADTPTLRDIVAQLKEMRGE